MNNKEEVTEKDLLSCLNIALYVFLVLPISAIFNGWVLSIMWKWFIMPFGLPSISIAEAIGLSLIFSFLKGGYTTQSDKKEKESVAYIVIRGLFLSFMPGLVILVLGYIVSLFM